MNLFVGTRVNIFCLALPEGLISIHHEGASHTYRLLPVPGKDYPANTLISNNKISAINSSFV
jgi:hypothetical protein